MTRTRLNVLALLLVSPSVVPASVVPAWAATESSADAAFARGDYQTALKQWHAQAQAGDAAAMRDLGMLYDTGHGVQQNQALALSWYQAAAQAGDGEAAFNVATMYDAGRGVSMDRAQAVKWYKIAAGRGVGRAAYNLGVIYRDGDGVPRDRDAAIRYFRQAAKAGLPAATPSLAALGAPLPPPSSSVPAEPAPPQPQVAQQSPAWPSPQDTQPPQAAEPQSQTASLPPDIQQQLDSIGAFLHTALQRQPLPPPLAKTFGEYVPTFRQEADQGDHMAEYNLGYAYQYGIGVEQDPLKSYMFYSRAGASDIPEVHDAAKSGLNDISASLSPDQQSQAREMAANNGH